MADMGKLLTAATDVFAEALADGERENLNWLARTICSAGERCGFDADNQWSWTDNMARRLAEADDPSVTRMLLEMISETSPGDAARLAKAVCMKSFEMLAPNAGAAAAAALPGGLSHSGITQHAALITMGLDPASWRGSEDAVKLAANARAVFEWVKTEFDDTWDWRMAAESLRMAGEGELSWLADEITAAEENRMLDDVTGEGRPRAPGGRRV